MNYKELKEITKQLKKTIPCNVCQKKFVDEDLQVISTYQQEGLFQFNCSNCKNQLMVHVSIMFQNEEKSANFNIKSRSADQVNPNEVLDMHNFLNKFNGDFKELFSL
jgi:transcription initiation factor IIE alpha subunit